MSERSAMLSKVSALLGRRSLVWAGIRGDDIESLADLPQLSASFSIIGAYRRRASVEGLALENNIGRRVDLEVWDIDDHRDDPGVIAFRRAMLRSLSKSSALLPYRPSRFLSAISFARRDRCTYLGLFGAHQFAFEHKPWVETSVGACGIPTIPWLYIADEEQLNTSALFDHGSVVLRRSRTSGGEGIVRVNTPSDLAKLWPQSEESFVSVAPFITGALPINVGGTVWRDGVSVHYPSVQLIGTHGCTSRPFGYCGNDFGLARSLETSTIDAIESSTHVVGNWLRSYGYLGSFGVDYLLDVDGVLRFTEVNPRFQGSTVASGRIAVEAGRACLLLEHTAAMLGVECPSQVPLRTLVEEMPPIAQLVVHWTGDSASRLDTSALRNDAVVVGAYADVLVGSDLETDHGALVARLTARSSITTDGFDLLEPLQSIVRRWNESMHPATTSEV